jgi:hypothetical protein
MPSLNFTMTLPGRVGHSPPSNGWSYHHVPRIQPIGREVASWFALNHDGRGGSVCAQNDSGQVPAGTFKITRDRESQRQDVLMFHSA